MIYIILNFILFKFFNYRPKKEYSDCTNFFSKYFKYLLDISQDFYFKIINIDKESWIFFI